VGGCEREPDPGEGDTIGKVDVEYCDSAWNHYGASIVLSCWNGDENPLGPDYGFVDAAIAHEYAHFLQDEIGTDDDHDATSHAGAQKSTPHLAPTPSLPGRRGLQTILPHTSSLTYKAKRSPLMEWEMTTAIVSRGEVYTVLHRDTHWRESRE